MAEETLTVNDDDVESKIKSAMHSRVAYFKSQSDSLTFEGVRRLLEKDLGMPELSLDSHKSFVKQLVTDFLNESAEESKEEQSSLTTKPKNPNAGEGNMEDSPVMGLLQKDSIQNETETAENESNSPNEEDVMKALWDRASYIKTNSESVTMAGLRRLLEEDLNVEKYSLDPFKKLISNELDEVLKASKIPDNKRKKSSNGKFTSKKQSSEEEKPSKQTRKRKITEKEGSPKKKTKKETNSNDSQSNSSAEIPKTKREISSTPTYGKRVEHLKSVLKSCGLNVSPAIYRKVKQLSEAQREAQLIKELEGILAKEGLSSNPSEKEIKEVKRKKERAKDLEGIDTSNIVSSSRRRGSYVPIKDIVSSESEEEDEDNEDNEDEDDEEIEENNHSKSDDEEDEDDDDGSNEKGEGDKKKEGDDEINEKNKNAIDEENALEDEDSD